jgi:cobalt-zinc-cadmium efflux system protein
MKYYEVYWVDSLLTLVIAIYLIVMGYNLLVSSLKVLMLFTPEEIPVSDIVNDIETIEMVKKCSSPTCMAAERRGNTSGGTHRFL